MDFRQKVIDREMSKPGLRGRINAFCISCIYDPIGSAGGWVQQVTACTNITCPLYDVRPQKSTEKGIKTTQLDDFSGNECTEMKNSEGGLK